MQCSVVQRRQPQQEPRRAQLSSIKPGKQGSCPRHSSLPPPASSILRARADTRMSSSPALLLVIALAAAAHLAPLAECDGPNPNPEIGNTGGLSLCLVAVPSFGVKLP
ncbi:hypothetical protein ZWY2020_049195 [Hordeum vulgare]|nr:hypothetical protein ZWY2020_049195 [Hordeum vulgare]